MIWSLLACVSTEPLTTVRAVRGDVEVQLVFHGELEAEKSVALVTPKLGGRPEVSFLAEHGARVEAGEVVARFNTEELEKDLKDLRSRRAVALTRIESELAKLSTTTQSAERAVTTAELDAEMAALRRTDSETVPRIEREQARVNAQQAVINTHVAKNRLRGTLLDSDTEVHLLRLQVADIDDEIARNEERIERSALVAPSAGLLLHEEQRWGQGRVKVGTELWPGSTVVRIPDLSTLRVRAWTHEVDAPRVQVGQVARIVLDAVPDEPTAAEVVQVADLAKPRGDAGIKHIEVRLELDETLEAMKPGMSVEVQLQVAKYDDEVNIPIDAVFYDANGAYAWVAGITGFTRHALVVRDQTSDVAVVQGLEEGTEVATFDPGAWERGLRP